MDMIKFLLKRPVAVCMTFFAFCLLGVIAYANLPVSLLPHIPVPEINVKVTASGSSAQEVEQSAIAPIRRELLTVGDVESIYSKSSNNHGFVNLRFAYNTDIDIALVEINEKIGKVTENLPASFDRPQIDKVNSTDIPVEYVTLTLKSDRPFEPTNTDEFVRMSELCEKVISRRIEQLPEVAMVDISGLMRKEIQITPKKRNLELTGITGTDIKNAVQASNVRPSAMRIRDGYFERTIHIENSLMSVEDIRNVSVKKNGRIYRIGDVCDVSLVPQEDIGVALSQGKRCVSMRVIKKTDAKVNRLREDLRKSLKEFSVQYPDIEFQESRDQTALLNYSIVTLKENFISSLVLMLIVAFVFMGDFKTPVVTAISMTVALIITFLAFFVFGMSLNILSLSGLILVVGMMIDNILITSENILMHEQAGEGIIEACARGTAEMITPMLSSTLTTIVVFIPLVFLSDMAGALFIDQSLAISIGLLVAYILALFLMPVLFMLFGKMDRALESRYKNHDRLSRLLTRMLDRFYDRGIRFVFRRSRLSLCLALLSIPLCFLFYELMPKARMPHTESSEMLAKISWDTNLPLEENVRRTNDIVKAFTPHTDYIAASVGTQGYMMETKDILSTYQTEIYMKASGYRQLEECKDSLAGYVKSRYPDAALTTSAADNIFDRVFDTGQAPVIVKLYPDDVNGAQFREEAADIERKIGRYGGRMETASKQREIVVSLNKRNIDYYGLDRQDVVNALMRAFKGTEVSEIYSTDYIPVVLKDNARDWNTLLRSHSVASKDGRMEFPLSSLVSYTYTTGLTNLEADGNGVMYPIKLWNLKDARSVAGDIRTDVLDSIPELKSAIGGEVASENKMTSGLIGIFLLSLLLMYFILCAQFESFTQPLIVLAEIPVDIAFAMLVLMCCGYSLNIMSGIGLIASCGIVINDSILKLDAINVLVKKGMKPQEAIHKAGKMRIRPIIMTSLTTVIGMVPFFFTNDLGSELQQSLALAMIAALCIGVPVSLFLIPLIYDKFILERKHRYAVVPADTGVIKKM